MQINEKECVSTCSELYSLQEQRDQMSMLHNQLLKQLRSALGQKRAMPSALSDSDYEAVLLRSKQLIDRQCKRIDELSEIESAYKHLSFEYSILEDTNKKLVAHVLALDDKMEEEDGLPRLVEVQQKSIHELRENLRESESKYERSIRQFHTSQKENRELRTMLEQHRSNLTPFFNQRLQMKSESNRLRSLLRNQEISYTQLRNKYEHLRAEYEALYENVFNQKKQLPSSGA
ncbi:MAG: hypothetical protein KZQ76_12220 [Candidatus Thiodiazotropha sp. (ex Epidulcina cf. delphinae)]|nr:hypothetical protein [Candidatus Thiodiazotropha sp. (ex Epidulcina cf. delphinae)]